MTPTRLSRVYRTRTGDVEEPITDILDVLKPSTVAFSGDGASERCYVDWNRAAKRQFFSHLPDGLDWGEIAQREGLSWAQAPLFVSLARCLLAASLGTSLNLQIRHLETTLGPISHEDLNRVLFGHARRALRGLLLGIAEPESELADGASLPAWLVSTIATEVDQYVGVVAAVYQASQTPSSIRN